MPIRRYFDGRQPLEPLGDGLRDEVEHVLAPALETTGVHQGALALRLWRDYKGKARTPAGRPETLAAATLYALVRMAAWEVRQAQVAEAFGVSAGVVATRFAEIRDALHLKRFDRRYVDDRPGWRIEDTVRAQGFSPIPEEPL